jgi:hypothetical protein
MTFWKNLNKSFQMIIILGAAIGTITSASWITWGFVSKVNANSSMIADLSEWKRTQSIEARIWAVEKRMWWLEERYGEEALEGNEGNQKNWKRLNTEKDCLENARLPDVKGYASDCSK